MVFFLQINLKNYFDVINYTSKKFYFSFFLNFLTFIFETERERDSQEAAERERETQNLKQAPGSDLSAQNPTWGSNP